MGGRVGEKTTLRLYDLESMLFLQATCTRTREHFQSLRARNIILIILVNLIGATVPQTLYNSVDC